MNSNNSEAELLSDFFDNPYTAEYVESIGFTIRDSIADILALTSILADMAAKSNEKYAMEYKNDIEKRSADILAAIALNNIFWSDAEVIERIRIDSFANDFFYHIKNVLGDKCNVTIKASCDAFIRAQANLMNFYILSILRKTLSQPFDKFNIEICTASEGGKVAFSITANKKIIPDNYIEYPTYDFFCDQSENILEMIRRRNMFNVKLNDNSICLIFDEDLSGETKASVKKKSYHTNKIQLLEERDRIFKKMLGI